MARNPVTYLLKKVFADLVKEGRPNPGGSVASSRRKFLKDGIRFSAGAIMLPSMVRGLAQTPPKAKIVIVGAGMAGLNAAYQLKKLGLASTVYEASARTGGRMFTLKDRFGKQITTDLGGEFVDTTHHDILQLSQELNVEFYDLRLDKLSPKTFYFGGKALDETDLREALQPFVAIIEKDVKSLPAKINYQTAEAFHQLDSQSITEYLSGIGIKGWLFDFLNVVLTREYGMEASEQSAINFLIMFSAPDELVKDYELFGEDHEVFKIKGGSQHLTDRLYAQIKDQVHLKHKLVSIKQDLGKGYLLQFQQGDSKVEVHTDYLILAIPFTIIRNISFEVPMPKEKRKCIDELGYGNSGKFVMGLNSKPWRKAGKQGYTFTDLAFGCGWDSSQSQSDQEGSFTVFAGGDLVDQIWDQPAESLTKKFLPALDSIYPGAQKSYTGKETRFFWSKNPYNAGGYSSFKKGQWSSLAGWEVAPIDGIYFAGEHVSLEFQGYMNGAAETGRKAALMIAQKLQVPMSSANLNAGSIAFSLV